MLSWVTIAKLKVVGSQPGGCRHVSLLVMTDQLISFSQDSCCTSTAAEYTLDAEDVVGLNLVGKFVGFFLFTFSGY